MNSRSPVELPEYGSMNMSMPASTPAATLSAYVAPGICRMPCQSEITKPSKPISPLSTSVISSWLACIFTASSVEPPLKSVLENDGMTEPTWCSWTAGQYGASASRSNSARVTRSMPWSIGYAPVQAFDSSYAVRPSPAKCLAVASTSSWRCRPSMIVSIESTSAGVSPKLS